MYGLSLSRGYRLGDLSSVYPVSRGVGLSLIPLAAALLLDESISAIAVLGIGMIAVGVYSLHIEPHALRDLAAPVRALNGPAGRTAVLTGVLIATYSLWDKNALDELSPVVLNQFAMTGHAMITTAVAVTRNPDDVRWEWRARGWSIVAAGVLIQLAYLLVLGGPGDEPRQLHRSFPRGRNRLRRGARRAFPGRRARAVAHLGLAGDRGRSCGSGRRAVGESCCNVIELLGSLHGD